MRKRRREEKKVSQSLPKAFQSLTKPPRSSPKSPQSFPKPSSSFPKLSPTLPKASPRLLKASQSLPKARQSFPKASPNSPQSCLNPPQSFPNSPQSLPKDSPDYFWFPKGTQSQSREKKGHLDRVSTSALEKKRVTFDHKVRLLTRDSRPQLPPLLALPPASPNARLKPYFSRACPQDDVSSTRQTPSNYY